MLEVYRWCCPRCGIVRDTIEQDGEPFPPWCRHNASDTAAERMQVIPTYHPYAIGVLPWGYTDPAISGA